MDRLYSRFEIRTADDADDARILTGVASDISTDRMGDIVVPSGAKFALPLPLLHQHNSHEPIGEVFEAKVSGKQITVKARIAKDSGLDYVEDAWKQIRSGLVKAFSIGFRVIKGEPIDPDQPWEGRKFLEWEWLELSTVTVPANAAATIHSIKSFVRKELAASGRKDRPVVRLDQPSAGVTANVIQRKRNIEDRNMPNVAEQLKSFESKRAALAERVQTIMEKAGEESRTLDAAEKEEYENLKTELEEVDEHLVRLRALEKTLISKATPLPAPTSTGDLRGSTIVAVEKKLPPGIEFTRYAMALGAARGELGTAYEIAKSRFSDTPRVVNVLKAAVAAGTTTDATWAGPLVEYNTFAGDFVDFLRPQTIIGQFGQGGVPSLNMVPFNVHIRGQISGGAGYWVGQGKAKPLTKFDFSDVYLGWAKVANIAVLTIELMRFSSPSAEALVRKALADALIARLDIDFVNPAKAAVPNVSPASITNGIAAIPSTGDDADAIRADIAALWAGFDAANISGTSAVYIMQPSTARNVGLMQNPLGQPQYPGMSAKGGTLGGVPVVVSNHVPTGLVILVNAEDVWLADDGQVVVDASREASLEMSDAPAGDSVAGTGAELVSMFQTNSVALRAERFINWKRRRDAGVAYLSGVEWGKPATP